MDHEEKFDNLLLTEWKAAFLPGMNEFAATRFFFSREDQGLMRIAFGNQGPVVSVDGRREAVFTNAVTLSPDIAVELARQILRSYSQPQPAAEA